MQEDPCWTPAPGTNRPTRRQGHRSGQGVRGTAQPLGGGPALEGGEASCGTPCLLRPCCRGSWLRTLPTSLLLLPSPAPPRPTMWTTVWARLHTQALQPWPDRGHR